MLFDSLYMAINWPYGTSCALKSDAEPTSALHPAPNVGLYTQGIWQLTLFTCMCASVPVCLNACIFAHRIHSKNSNNFELIPCARLSVPPRLWLRIGPSCDANLPLPTIMHNTDKHTQTQSPMLIVVVRVQGKYIYIYIYSVCTNADRQHAGSGCFVGGVWMTKVRHYSWLLWRSRTFHDFVPKPLYISSVCGCLLCRFCEQWTNI